MSFRRLCTQAYESHSSQCCGVKLIDTQCKTVAVMVSYYSILRELCGHKVCREFLVNPIVVNMKQAGAEQPPISAAASFSVEIFECYSATSCSIKQFEDQTTTRLLTTALEEYEDSWV